MPTEEEIDAVLNQCAEAADEGTNFRGLSYEEGVAEGIRWIRGELDGSPLDE